MKVFIIIVSLLSMLPVWAQQVQEKITVSDNLKINKLSDKVYMFTSYMQTESWGKVGANGLILVESNKALLIDTPWNDNQTQELYDWIKNSLHTSVTEVVVSHWHDDCMGGLAFLQTKGVVSYANQQTIEIAKEKGLPLPEQGFTDFLEFEFENIPIECYYLGGGHTTDNIEVWIPSEKILFGGCAVKDMTSVNLGNLSDADVDAWPETINRMIKQFPEAAIVVPGHGAIGGCELMQHTLDLLKK